MTRAAMLAGIQVLDFTHIVAGSHCTKLMAEYRAESIKIEPLTGDPAHTQPFTKEGRGGNVVQRNLGEKTMAMDLATSEAPDIYHALSWQSIARPDVLDDPGFVDSSARANHRQAVSEAISTWLAKSAMPLKPCASSSGNPGTPPRAWEQRSARSPIKCSAN